LAEYYLSIILANYTIAHALNPIGLYSQNILKYSLPFKIGRNSSNHFIGQLLSILTHLDKD